MQLAPLLSVFLFAWVLILTIALYFQYQNFSRFYKGVNKDNLIKILEKALEQEKMNSQEIAGVKRKIETLEDADRFHIQKVGVVRFNPFKELGGEHSFSVALLDGDESGFLITGLHTRERTRVYLKDVKKGKSGVELSEEEKRALKKALATT